MNAIKFLSPLAVILAALAVAPAAHAQSTSTVQLKPLALHPSLVASARVDGSGTVGFATDNDNDFRQRWTRTKSSQPATYLLSRFGFSNACIRVPDTVSSADVAEIRLGSCSGTRAQWRLVGDHYINRGTNHHLATDFCVADSCAPDMLALPSSMVPDFGELARWGHHFL